MRTTSILLVIAALTAAAAAPLDLEPAAAEEGGASPVRWLGDLDAARAEARKTGKPILAVFT